MKKYSVIIVGGGIGGSVTAYYLAQAGFKNVLMLEKEQFPREKICGDGEVSGIFPMLKEMGIYDEVAQAGRMMHGTTFVDSNENAYTFYSTKDGVIEHGEHSFCTTRYIFDDIVNRCARNTGIDYMDNFEVTQIIKERGVVKGIRGIHNGRMAEFESDMVVLANGSHSMLARDMGFFEEDPLYVYYGVRGYFENVKGMKDVIEFFYTSEEFMPGGYTWLFPLTETRANVGIFISEKALRSSNKTQEEMLWEWINNTKYGQERLKDAHIVGNLKGWRLPCGMRQKVRDNGIIAVGDAGNMIEELLGGGIINAFFAGKEAAISIAEAIEADDFSADFLQNYQARVDDVIGSRTKRMNLLRANVFDSVEDIGKFIGYCNEHYDGKIVSELAALGEYMQYLQTQKK